MSKNKPHNHNGDHYHDHSHDAHRGNIWERVAELFHMGGHTHSHAELAADQAFLDNREGIRTVWLAIAALTITSILQIIIVMWSGSVALFADTVHNIGDGLNSVPLLIAFYLAGRAATRRYSYGFGKAEDIAGIFIVLSIFFSAVVIFWESYQKLLNPEPLANLGWIAVAALVGFLGNEAVALLQIRVGRKIGSAALVADGFHARTDGLTSLAVLLAAAGSWLGYPMIDPIIGILIGVAILFITRDAAVAVWYRLMDAVDPGLLSRAEEVIRQQEGVEALRRLRMRWIGHCLHAEVTIAVDPLLTTVQNHQIAEKVRHELFHQIPNMREILVHIDPWEEKPESAHQLTIHHESVPRLLE